MYVWREGVHRALQTSLLTLAHIAYQQNLASPLPRTVGGSVPVWWAGPTRASHAACPESGALRGAPPAAQASPDASQAGQLSARCSSLEGFNDLNPNHSAPRRQVAGAGPGAQRVRPAHRPARDRRLECAAGGPQALGAVPARRAPTPRAAPRRVLQASCAFEAVCTSWHVQRRLRGSLFEKRGPAQHILSQGL